MSFDTPILLIVFNRPQHTAKVFERIRQVKPRQLFVAADGPRTAVPEDAAKCVGVRDLILKGVDWECELKTLFRDQNRGCGHGPAEAITWFFENVEEGIILEDDCLPDLSFFGFCNELLSRFRSEKTIMHIGGSNHQGNNRPVSESYYFSLYPHSWGWATWRRAWKNFEYRISDGASQIYKNLVAFMSTEEAQFWSDHYIKTFSQSRNDIWDYQWCYAVWKNKGLSILPSYPLIKNLGFGEDATHTKKANFFDDIELRPIGPLHHPVGIQRNSEADRYTFERHFKHRTSLLNHFRNFGYRYVNNHFYNFLRSTYRKVFKINESTATNN